MSEWSGRPQLAFFLGNEEDRFTEYLAQLLQDKTVLRRFLTEACDIPLEDHRELPVVRTQVTASGGRADLVLRRDPYLYLLFEAKVASWFHDGQLLSYVRELTHWQDSMPDGRAFLGILCPGRSLLNALTEAEAEVGSVSSSPTIKGISWEQVASFCRDVRTGVDDERLRFHLTEFAGIIEWRLGKDLRPLTEEEARLLSDPMAGLVLEKSRRLVDWIVEEVTETMGGAVRTTSSSGRGYDGFWLHAGGRKWWFGLWFEAWPQIGTPLVFQLKGWARRPRPELPTGLPLPTEVTTSFAREWVLPFVVRPGVELREVATVCARWMEEVVYALPESGEPA